MLNEIGEELSRWERFLVRQVRSLHPDQLRVELQARRFRHRPCFEALIERAEGLLARDPEGACRLAKEARSWVERYASGEAELRISALSLLGEALSRSGAAAEAKAAFREALELGSGRTPEVGALWWRYALYLGTHEKKALESLRWAASSVDLFLELASDPRVGATDRTSLAAAWLARGLAGWLARESASDVSRCYLAAALEATEKTPRTALEACRGLARTAPVAWMSEDVGLHPWKVLRRLRRLDRHLAGESRHSPCRCRVQGLQGLALAHVGLGLTPQSESYLSEAKGALVREGSSPEVVALDLDLAYILLWEGRWTQLAKVAQEILGLVAEEEGRGARARALEAWAASLARRRLEPQAWRSVYREVRGVRAPLILPEGEGSGGGASLWVTGW